MQICVVFANIKRMDSMNRVNVGNPVLLRILIIVNTYSHEAVNTYSHATVNTSTEPSSSP